MPGEIERRIDVVDRLVDRLTAADRPKRSIVLRGPAGIGKSHLARRIAERLAATGMPVRRISGGEAQRHLAFGALLHLLPPGDAPVAVEFELVQRLRSALIAQGQTSVLIVDDIALLDERSAGLIESVLHFGDAVVVATERSPIAGVPADHALTSLMRELADVVDVPPMNDDELSDLLLDWSGPGEVGSVRHLTEMSRGNPLVLRELYTATQSSGAIHERGGLWYLDDDFRPSGTSLERLVVEHLDRLGDAEWELMRCLAVAGTLSREVAARIDVESLETLERDGLLKGQPTMISHPLYAEVIVDSLSPEQIRRVCSKLVASVGPADEVDAARLGSWLLHAAHGIDDGVARRGAALALGRWENDLARRLIEAIEQPTVVDRVMLIWAHANAGDIDAASAAADAAVGAAVSDHERVHAGLARAELWALQLNRSTDSYEALAELRDTLSDPTLIAQVDGATALYSQMTGNSTLASRAGASAVASRPTVDDDATRLAVLIADAFGKVFSGSFVAAGSVIEAGLELAERRGVRHQWVRLKVADALRLMMLGDLDASNRIIGHSLDLADVSGVRPAHVVWLGLASQIAQVEGDAVLAERRAREAVRAGDHVDDFGAAGFVRGDLGALLVELGHPADDLETASSSSIGLARRRIRAAELDEVDQLAAELAVATADAGYKLWAPWVAREAVRRTASPRCAALLAQWASEFDGPVVRQFSEFASGVVDGDARRALSSAQAFESIGFVVPALDAYVAGLELDLARSGSSSELRRQLLAVCALAETTTPPVPRHLRGRLEALREGVDLPSERQLEIARLAASGKASKQIAAELIVSARTVDNHLAAVYRKLGVNSREELAQIVS